MSTGSGQLDRHRLVIFDLDNTLCDHRSSLLIRLDHAFQEAFPDDDERSALIRQSVAVADDGTSHFGDLLGGWGITDHGEIDRIVDRYQSDRYRGLRLFEDALDGLRATGEQTQIAMITNGPTDIQQPKLDLLGIEPLFSFVLISESVGFWKPDPRIFELALDEAGVAAHEAVYIGDSPGHDVAGAKAAGLTSIWMNRREEVWEGNWVPDHVATNLREALDWLGIGEA